MRTRRDEWTAAGVFDAWAETMVGDYKADTIGLDLDDAMVDGSIHKPPCGGEGIGKSPVDRGKLGSKLSLATDAEGIPIGWVAARANHSDSVLLPATLEAVDDGGLLEEISTLHLDRGYDNGVVRARVAELGIGEMVLPKVRPKAPRVEPGPESRSGAVGRWSAPTNGPATTTSSGATSNPSSCIVAPSCSL